MVVSLQMKYYRKGKRKAVQAQVRPETLEAALARMDREWEEFLAPLDRDTRSLAEVLARASEELEEALGSVGKRDRDKRPGQEKKAEH